MPQRVEFSLFPTEAIKGARLRVKLGTEVLKDYGPVALAPMTTLKVGVPVADLEAAKEQDRNHRDRREWPGAIALVGRGSDRWQP